MKAAKDEAAADFVKAEHPPARTHIAPRGKLLQRYTAGKRGSDFNRPLRYPSSGVV